MNNLGKFTLELITTVIVAAVLSLLFSVMTLFIVGNIGSVSIEGTQWINMISGSLFGLIVGYKLNILIREHRGSGVKKKK